MTQETIITDEKQLPEWMIELIKDHPIFTYPKESIACNDIIPSYHVFIRNDELFVLIDSEIRVLNLSSYQERFYNKITDLATLQEYVTLIIPSHITMGQIHSYRLNKSGTLLALLCRYGLFVVELPIVIPHAPHRTVYHFHDTHHQISRIGSSSILDETHCQLILFDEKALHVISDYQWHPYSTQDCHLMIITRDSILRLYNVLEDKKVPEQIFSSNTHPKHGYSFAFHSNPPRALLFPSYDPTKPISDPWFYITLFYICQDGSLYCLCPLLPKNSSIPLSLWNVLDSSSETTINWINILKKSSKPHSLYPESLVTITVPYIREFIPHIQGPFNLYGHDKSSIIDPSINSDPFINFRLYNTQLASSPPILILLSFSKNNHLLDVYYCIEQSFPLWEKDFITPSLVHSIQISFPIKSNNLNITLCYDLIMSLHLSQMYYCDPHTGFYCISPDHLNIRKVEQTSDPISCISFASTLISYSIYQRSDYGGLFIFMINNSNTNRPLVTLCLIKPTITLPSTEIDQNTTLVLDTIKPLDLTDQLKTFLNSMPSISLKPSNDPREYLAEGILRIRDEYMTILCSIQSKSSSKLELLEKEGKRQIEIKEKLNKKIASYQSKNHESKLNGLIEQFGKLKNQFVSIYRNLLYYSNEKLSKEEKNLCDKFVQFRKDLDLLKIFLDKSNKSYQEFLEKKGEIMMDDEFISLFKSQLGIEEHSIQSMNDSLHRIEETMANMTIK